MSFFICATYCTVSVSQNAVIVYQRNLNGLSLYRGQADCSWGLTPKVYREDRFQHEYAFIQEFERLRPDEFRGLSYIEKLIKMQHYGLPTRLLDFSENPLVALYFACSSKSNWDKDGVVYALGGYPVNHQDFVWISRFSFQRVDFFLCFSFAIIDHSSVAPSAPPARPSSPQ